MSRFLIRTSISHFSYQLAINLPIIHFSLRLLVMYINSLWARLIARDHTVNSIRLLSQFSSASAHCCCPCPGLIVYSSAIISHLSLHLFIPCCTPTLHQPIVCCTSLWADLVIAAYFFMASTYCLLWSYLCFALTYFAVWPHLHW